MSIWWGDRETNIDISRRVSDTVRVLWCGHSTYRLLLLQEQERSLPSLPSHPPPALPRTHTCMHTALRALTDRPHARTHRHTHARVHTPARGGGRVTEEKGGGGKEDSLCKW